MMNTSASKPDPARIKPDLIRFSVPRDLFENRQNLLKIQGNLEKELLDLGYHLERIPFSFQGETFENLRAFRYRPVANEKRLIIGAHFDAVPGTPGADDNASGVAALLETARLTVRETARRPVEFLFFNAEEYGMIGSAHYVRRLKREKIPVFGMLSLEMIGYTDSSPGSQTIPFFLKPFYPDKGNFLALVGDFRSGAWLKEAQKSFKAVPGLPVETLLLPAKGWVLPETRLSDHSPFWDAGYPALLVTDTSFFRNPHYHLPGDTVETLNIGFLEKVTAGVIEVIRSF